MLLTPGCLQIGNPTVARRRRLVEGWTVKVTPKFALLGLSDPPVSRLFKVKEANGGHCSDVERKRGVLSFLTHHTSHTLLPQLLRLSSRSSGSQELSVALRFSLVDEAAALAVDDDSDDEELAHHGSPCLARVRTPAAPRCGGHCEWPRDAMTKVRCIDSS